MITVPGTTAPRLASVLHTGASVMVTLKVLSVAPAGEVAFISNDCEPMPIVLALTVTVLAEIIEGLAGAEVRPAVGLCPALDRHLDEG